MLSDLSFTNKERGVYETIEVDHEYEILDKYNQPQYDDVKIPPIKSKPAEAESAQLQPLPSTGDYEFTQCPAYIPVATTNVIGTTNKPVEIPATPSQPGTQLTPAQDDQKWQMRVVIINYTL